MAKRASRPAGKARKPDRVNGKSLSPQKELSELLKCRFPEVFVEGKIDGDKLRQSLGEELDTNNERYGLSWAGKAECFRHIQETTTATLRPRRSESVDFDKTENIFIEGDNLEVLKILQKTYQNKIKMIYIDPPYNTGNDSFIYPDRYKEEKEDYELRAGIKDAEGLLTKDGFWRKNSKDAGHFHSNWLSMMYPRLFLAKNLLREDGVIFVSIGDEEMSNLRCIMDEIFGEENFLGMITWKARVKPVNIGDAKYRPQREVEYVFVYQKEYHEGVFQRLITGSMRTYPHDLNGRKYRLATILKSNRGANIRSTMVFELDGYTPPDGQRWQAGEDVIRQLHHDGYIEFREGTPLIRYFEDEEGAEHDPFYCFMEVDWSSTSEAGKNQLNEILGDRHGFDTVKPTRLVSTLVQSCTKSSAEDIIMDFFSGSCTTAHAIMSLNSESSGNRKFLCVQIAEPCEPDGEAFKAGFSTVADIGKERIRRAGKKIKKEMEGNLTFDKNRLDLGFKVFRLEESNFKQWRENVRTGEELKEQMRMFVDNVKKGAGSEDMLFEIILKNSRFDLNVKIEKQSFAGVDYYRLATEDPSTTLRAGSEGTEKIKAVSGNKRIHHEEKEGHEGKTNANEIICLDTKITKKFVDKVLEEKPERFTCLDIAFKNNDQLKTNTALQMESAKIEFKVI